MTLFGTTIFGTTIDRTPMQQDPRSFARYLRAAGRRARRRNGGGGMVYEIVVAVLWFGPGVAYGIWQDLGIPRSGPSPLNWAAGGLALLAGGALVGLGCAALGPVTASREWRAWVLSTPLDRGVLLRRRAIGVLLLAVVPGIVIGALVADATGYRHGQAFSCVLIGVGCSVAAAGLSMWQQRMAVAGVGRGRGWLWWALGLFAAAVVADLLGVGTVDGSILWAVVGVVAVGAAFASAAGLAGVGWIPLSSLAAGSGSLSSIALAIQDQSLAPLAAVLAPPPGRRRTGAPVRPMSGTGQRAVIAMDRRRTFRNRAAIARWVAMALVPYAAWLLLDGVSWAPSALAAVTFVAGVAAISGLCSTVRQFAGTPTLADRYGLGRSESRRSGFVLPEIATAVWAVAVAPALFMHTSKLMVVLIPLGVLALVEFRAAQRPFESKFVMGQQYSRDMTRRFVRGPALLLGGSVGFALLVAGLLQRQL